MCPGAPPKANRYVYTGPGRCLRWSPSPPGPPWSLAVIKYIIYEIELPAKFYVCSDVPHTHTPCLRKGGLLANEVKERLKREWRWYESEDEMKNYPTGTRGGERKRRGRGQTPTPTHLARSGQTLKGQGKRKAEADGHGKRPAEGGRTEMPEPTYHSETYAYLGTHRTQPTWGGKNAWNRGPNGELVGEEEWSNKKVKWDSVQT